MKHYTLYILAAVLLGMLNIQPTSAQQNDQNALYIFRNDGSFNAFFYADIDSIQYSKVDTLGVEQDDYVVQEVYALDSCFRIPLSAIDSVLFVTPKNVVKTDVVCPDKAMTDYIIASDTVSWFRLSASAPESVIPKVGDKLLIEDPVAFLPDGFSGRVSRVDVSDAGYTVETDVLELEDLYDRFVAKVSAGAPGSSSAARRRIPGVEELIDAQYESKEDVELPTLSGSLSLASFSGDAVKAFNDNFAISLEGSGSLNYTIEPKLKEFKAFLYADVAQGVKYYQYMKFETKSSIDLTVSGTVGANLDIPINIVKDAVKSLGKYVVKEGGTKIARNFGFFYADYGFGLFLNCKGVVNAKISSSETETHLFTIHYDGPFGQIPIAPDFHVRSSTSVIDGDVEGDGWGYGLTAAIGVYAKADAKVRFLGRTWKTEARAEAGVRIQENISVNPNEVASTKLMDTPALYTKTLENDKVTRDFYCTANLSLKKGLNDFADFTLINFTPVEFSIGSTDLFTSIPEAKDITWDVDKKAPWRGSLTVPFDGHLMFGKPVGIGVFDVTEVESPKQVEDFWYPAKYTKTSVFSRLKETFEDLEPSKNYKAYPQIMLYKYPLLANKDVTFTLGAPMLDIKNKTVYFDKYNGFKDIEVITNVKNTEFTADADWLNSPKPGWVNEIGQLTVYAQELPDGTKMRKGNVIGICKDKDGKELLRDTIVVTQLEPIIKAMPGVMEFDIKGGTQKATVETTLDNLQVWIYEGGNATNFYTMTYDAKAQTITVVVPENTTGQERSGIIMLKGTSPFGETVEDHISISQLAEEFSPYYITFDKNNVEVGKDADTYEFTSECNFYWYKAEYSHTFEVNGDDRHRWFEFKNGEYEVVDGKCIDKWYLTVEKNDWGFDRKAVIDLLVYDKDSTMTAKTQITIVQKGNDTQEGPVFPTKFDEASLLFSGKFKQMNHHKDEDGDKDEKWETEYVDGIQVNVKDLSVSSTKNSLHFSGTYSEEENGKYGYDKYISNYSEQFSLSIKNITGLKEKTGINWKGNYFEGSYIDHISASNKSSSEWVKGNSHDLSSTECNFSTSTNVSAGSYGEDPWHRWRWTWESNEISHGEFSYFFESIHEFYRPDGNDHIKKELSRCYDWTPVPGEKYSIKFTAVGYLPEEASSRTRGAQEKQTATSTERITRHVER